MFYILIIANHLFNSLKAHKIIGLSNFILKIIRFEKIHIKINSFCGI